MGFAAEVAHCLYLCGETWRKGDKGATNDMLACSVEQQGWAALLGAARTAKVEIFGASQLMRAALQNNLPRVLQLVQLGAPLELKDKSQSWTALHWACFLGHEHVARALLDGKYEGRGAEVDARSTSGYTALMSASIQCHEGILRLLLERGARQELQSDAGLTALHLAAYQNRDGVVALLCAASGAAAALALRWYGKTPLGWAIEQRSAACEAVLRARGAPE
jgi:ankyrin repeat protein